MKSPKVWIDIRSPRPSESGKTKRWMVFPINEGKSLGEIAWFGRWRCYAFYPAGSTIFEKDCLRVIADFCEEKTKEHRESIKK